MAEEHEFWVTPGHVRLRDESALFEHLPYEIFDFKRKELHLATRDDFELIKYLRHPRSRREIDDWARGREELTDRDTLEEMGVVERSGISNLSRPASHLFESFPMAGKPHPPMGFPSIVMLQPTHSCNLVCRHCSAHADRSRKKDELTLGEIEGILDELERCDCRTLRLTGGEPMNRPDFFEIAEMIRKKNLNFFLFTNGTLLTEENVKRFDSFDRASFQIHLSLDGLRENHNWLRGRKDAFDGVTNAFDLLTRHHLPFCVEMTLNQRNCREIEAVTRLCATSGAYALTVHPAQTLGRGSRESEIWLPVDTVRKIAEEVDDIALRYSRHLNVSFFLYTIPAKLVFSRRHDRREELKEALAAQPAFKRPFSRCGAGMGQFTIASNGEVYACPLCVDIPGHSAGSVREKTLLEIWRDEKKWAFYRGGWNDEDLNVCGTCPSKPICNVGSHCRPNSFHAHGDLMGPPVECLKDYRVVGLKKRDVDRYVDTHLKGATLEAAL